MQDPGRPSAVPARRREQIEELYSTDPKFKKYGQQIEKCLGSFENVQEWADCIAFLKNLLRTLQAYSQFKAIPRKLIVSKRLSQCLNPSLPSGVHQRALEVYGHIFAVLGSDGIRRDLAIWTSGLFPFFEYAATSIKPALLGLYDTHFLALQEDLRPAMRSFTLCLLPGLEEETGEFFDQVLSLLDKLSGTVSPAYFFQNLWLIMLTSPSARGTALTFLSRRLPRLNADEDITPIVGRDTGLMIRAVSAALEDENLLVQRAALDLLLQALRLDSKTVKSANDDDRAILMRAAYGVVLRRDLALNRRVYNWLLGTSDSSQAQSDFYHAHSLSLLAATLREDMKSPSAGYAFARPFKIMVSLLDKWELGGPLSELLVVDVLKTLRLKLLEDPVGENEDISMTGNTLYEAIEPMLLWKQVFSMIVADVAGMNATIEGIRLATFVLDHFTHDEEVKSKHLPVVLAALVELLNVSMHAPSIRIGTAIVGDTFSLVQKLIACSLTLAAMTRPSIGATNPTSSSSAVGPLEFACLYYGVELPGGLSLSGRSSDIPLITLLEDVLQLTLSSSIAEEHQQGRSQLLDQVSDRAMAALLYLLDKEDIKQSTRTLQWDPQSWMIHVLTRVKDPATSFTTTSNFINVALIMHEHPVVEPRLKMDSRSSIDAMINAVFDYLRPTYAAYHLRAVQTIWALDAISKESHVESILAKKLSASLTRDASRALDAFGVLWRLTDDEMTPGYRLQTPMLAVLHNLSSEDAGSRRMAEAWMRNSLRSVLRVVDPLLRDLAAVETSRSSVTVRVNGRQIPLFLYERSIDQRRLRHLIGLLSAVLRYGGQAYLKVLRTSIVSRNPYTRISRKEPLADATYMDLVMELLLSYLQSEPADGQEASMNSFNLSIQTVCADLLQLIVARGGVDDIMLKTIESTAISRLHLAIHKGRLDVQNKLLHLLHTVLLASAAVDGAESSRPSTNTFLTQILVDGISVPSNRPVLQQWFDFILTTIPNPRFNMESSSLLLLDHVGRQLRAYLAGSLKAYEHISEFRDADTAASDFDFGLCLTAFEALALSNFTEKTSVRDIDSESMTGERTTSESGGIFGFFGSDTASAEPEPSPPVSSAGNQALRQAVPVLVSLTISLPRASKVSTHSDLLESMFLIFDRTSSRCRRVFEQLWRVRSLEVFECILECWDVERKNVAGVDLGIVFDLVDHLAASAQVVVQMLCDRISLRLATILDKSRKQSSTVDNFEWILYAFLEDYLRRLEGPVATQVWPRFSQLAKEVATNWRELKLQAYAMLRCTTVICDKVLQSNILDDRRQRREFQDMYARLLEGVVLLCSRDQSSRLRRTTKDSIPPTGRDSPLLRVASNSQLDEKFAVPRTPMDTSTVEEDTSGQIVRYLRASVVPNLRRFLVDADKITATCSNMVQNVIVPAARGKQKPLDVDEAILHLLQELTSIPASLKTWRNLVYEALNDARVFNSTASAGRRWQLVVAALVDGDKTILTEMLGKVAVAPSANIFTNREYEMLLQSLSLRRLSYILLTGEKNHHLNQLPSVVEKLAEIFKNVPSAVVQSEVYLCLRVLLCRLSPHNLTVFWPVLLTELFRTFEDLLRTLPADSSESLTLILAACKFIDLLLVLQTEEFQIYQWMFITDTVDAVNRTDDWRPDALLDQLAEVAADHPVADTRDANPAPEDVPADAPTTPSPLTAERMRQRRPMLAKLRQIDSVRDLVPFFSHASIATYEAVYASGGNVDWDTVEQSILEDMFDGQ